MDVMQSTMTLKMVAATANVGGFLTQHMGAVLAMVLASPLAASVLVRLLNKIPLGAWFDFLRGVGTAISRVGNMRLHRVIYEPLETWFQNFLVGSVNAIDEGLDADDSATSDKEEGMNTKGLMLLVGLALGAAAFAPKAKASDVLVDTSFGSFMVPFKVVNGTQLYSFREGKGFPGAETVLWEKGKGQFTAGAAPVLGTDTNVPFLGLQTRLSERFFDTSNNQLQFGAWVGFPSRRLNDERPRVLWGLKASVALW